MEFITQYLDVLITALITGLSGYGISQLSSIRNKKKERLERERKFVEKYIEIIINYQERIIGIKDSIENDVDKDIFWEEWNYILDNVFDNNIEEGLIESMSEYATKLDKILEQKFEKEYDDLTKLTSDFSATRGTNRDTIDNRKSFLISFQTHTKALFEKIRKECQSFYTSNF